MQFSKVCLYLILAAILFAPLAKAQDSHQHQHPHDSSEKLGKVNFTVSCGVETQKQFNRAAAMLHSFWYEEAGKAFSEIAATDRACPMAYWGIAMSAYTPLWAPPRDADLRKGWEALEKARAIPAKTERERDYLAAIETFYKDFDKLDHRTRSLAYEKAMERVYLKHTQDREAGIFYALSLLGTALPTDKSYANQKKAAEILNGILPTEPEHPGVAHYLIHSFDYPPLASLALPAARSYAKIAPASPHALHMPSHIFTRLGLWDESIESNIASATSAKDHVAKTHPGVAAFDQLHAMDYLEYAYLQGAEDIKAKRVADEVSGMGNVDQETVAAAYAFAAIPARYAIERRRWSEAATLTAHPSTFPWARFRFAEAITYFARALGAARSGNPSAARLDVDKLAAIQAALLEAKESYWASQVEIQRLGASGWIAKADGRTEEALKLARAAADLESSTEKHPVTPGAIIPARELLGELLLELNQPGPALTEFEKALGDSPNRFNGIYGAGRAAELSGDSSKAKTYYTKLVDLCKGAEFNRAELQKAKAFLAR
ncbi:MAG: hypothetical protein ABI882_05780 [Acidobacteriota bacterium]